MTRAISVMGMELDPRMTFDALVVGPANRLASAAARRAAESPGTSYNPLFLYSASGLGKSHILTAVAQHAARHHEEMPVMYQTLEGYLDELTQSLQRGDRESMRDRYMNLRILLLDDIQFLTGQDQAQEILLRTLDALTNRGAQVVLASDRPPAEIDDLDARLLSRFSGGLIVDIGKPDYEMRVAIMRRKAEEREAELAPGVAEAMAHFPFKNVRELQGALNRIFAVQELEERTVSAEDLPAVLGRGDEGGEADEDEFTELLERLPNGGDPGHRSLEEPVWRRRIHQVAAEARTHGVAADAVLRLLDEVDEPEDWKERVERFREEVTRVREIRNELDRLGNPWPEAAATLLKDPERLEEAETLLASARERVRPFPTIPGGPRLEDLAGRLSPLALRAAVRLVQSDRPDYYPLYVHSPDPERGRSLLEASGRTFLETRPDEKVGLISVHEFANEFIRSMSTGVAGAWRERWWGVDLLLLHGIEELGSTERAQDEFFHLFETLKRRGARVLLAADRAPARMEGVDDRLRSRFEGGLVVGLGEQVGDGRPLSEDAQPVQAPRAPMAEEGKETTAARNPASHPEDMEERDDLTVLRELAGVPRGRRARGAARPSEDGPVVAKPPDPDPKWYPSPEKVIWEWPSLEDRIADAEIDE